MVDQLMRSATRTVLFTVITALTAGCGWRLQGDLDFPPDLQTVRVAGGSEDTREALTAMLIGAGLSAELDGDPDLLLMIHRDVAGERMVSVTAGGRPNEFEVYRVIEFSLARAGELILDHRQIELTADYTHSTIDVLARQQEARQLADSLDGRVRQQLLLELEQAVAH